MESLSLLNVFIPLCFLSSFLLFEATGGSKMTSADRKRERRRAIALPDHFRAAGRGQETGLRWMEREGGGRGGVEK